MSEKKLLLIFVQLLSQTQYRLKQRARLHSGETCGNKSEQNHPASLKNPAFKDKSPRRRSVYPLKVRARKTATK